MPTPGGHLTHDDLAANVDQDIAEVRARQRELQAAGHTFAAAEEGTQIDALLDERRRYV